MKGLNDMSKRKIRLLADYVVRQIFDCAAVESKAKIKVVFIGGTEIEINLLNKLKTETE